MSVTVQVSGLSLSYGSKRALSDINATFAQSELTSIVGPSGCGKTSLLRSIAGFLRPQEGSIQFGDRDVTALTPQKRRCGMVFQQYALWPHLSVFQNVAYGLKIRGEKSDVVRQKVFDLLDRVEIPTGDVTSRHPQSYSGGQQQRIALARALVTHPDVLLLDEPLSNLDAKVRARLRVEIRRIQQDFGITAIYVTHDQQEALSMSDQVIIMNKGLIEQHGSPEVVFQQPASLFVAEFLGDGNTVRTDADPGATLVIRNTDVVLAASGSDAAPTESWSTDAAGLTGIGTVQDVLYLGDRFRHLVRVNGQDIVADIPDRVADARVRVTLPAGAIKRFS